MYDSHQSEQGKAEGMKLAAQHRAMGLARARTLAIEIALRWPSREVTSDMVGLAMTERNLKNLGPAMGSIFRGKEWQFTGRYVKSIRITNHSRMLRVWKYVG